ncbi:hypothetical protein GWO53_03310 [Corynebacterium macginleyi]|uniref:Uncharacterized protein n=1 Tax=Corynebacterium macginleyi TaxID=38290 RepID=A0A3M0GAY0_9CORY|nr:hypothetical protein [Corynebacterium macginleyi]MBK4139541.1 hypothetical protein [Corynebacterium macginleyi]MBK4144144.1 hypothetical protein [Corynebacterium macginleyi]MBK4149571.1 hypothetical protein [Corynebacterium macginleyi]MBK4153130.1 hypothetical protein [Corynebacterium macginleyi]MBK4155983.1 hypothetical protein [Corynebacterium macginleyi]
MANYLYVRTELSVPGVGSAIHLAELEEQDTQRCRMHRLIALDAAASIVGLATPRSHTGNVDKPQEVVPHPDTYSQYPDISASYMDHEQFEALWTEATTKFGL